LDSYVSISTFKVFLFLSCDVLLELGNKLNIFADLQPYIISLAFYFSHPKIPQAKSTKLCTSSKSMLNAICVHLNR
jgi:hypothetical protein